MRHVEIDCFEEPSIGEAAAQISHYRVARFLPLLDVKDEIRIVDLKMLGDRQLFAPQNPFERRTRRVPNLVTVIEQSQRTSNDRTQRRFSRTQRAMKVNLAKHVIPRLQI